MAADLIDAATRDFAGVPRSPTAGVPLVGAAGFAAARAERGALAARAGVTVATVERLLRRYGDRVHDLLALIEEHRDLAEPLDGGEGHLAAEVVYAATHEGALRLEDVLARRTRLAITSADRGRGGRGADGRAVGCGAQVGCSAGRARDRDVASARGGRAGGRGRARRRARAAGLPRSDGRRALTAPDSAVTALVLGLDQGTSSTR